MEATEQEHLKNEVIIALADKYGKTPAQIVLRWELQRGIIVLPKSTHQGKNYF